MRRKQVARSRSIKKKLLVISIGIMLCGFMHAQEKTVKGMTRTFDEVPVEKKMPQRQSMGAGEETGW